MIEYNKESRALCLIQMQSAHMDGPVIPRLHEIPSKEQSTGTWAKIRHFLENFGVSKPAAPPPKNEDIRLALVQWQAAEKYFESVHDPDLVDYAAYQLEAARRRYACMMKKARQEQNSLALPSAES